MARSELLSPQGRSVTLFGNPATVERDSQTLANKMAKDDLRRRLLKGKGSGALPTPAPTASPEPSTATPTKTTLPTSFLYAVEKNRAGVQAGPTRANAAAQAPAAMPGAPAPRATSGLALLEQMQNDRAAGLAPGASSSLSGPGSTRKLESDAGKAERLARRYINKFGRFGASAAGGLLENAAAERSGTPGVKSEAYRKADQAIEAEAQGVAVQTTAVEKAELENRIRRIEQGRTGKAGRGTPISKKAQP